jgi:thiamine pyrophosphate-dependent acetolactate synthase large subunit-like protein
LKQRSPQLGQLRASGVKQIFGYPGDGLNGIFGALNRAEEKIRFIQARHEEMAAFMASAHAKFQAISAFALRRPDRAHRI